MVGIRRTSGKYPWNATEEEKHMLDIGKAKRRILNSFEYGLSIEDVAEQNDILKTASREWLELNAQVEQLKEEEK